MTVVDNVTTSADSFFTTITDYAASHSDGIIAILLLCGVVLAFTGHTLLRPTVFLIGSLPTTTVICAFGLALLADHHPTKAPSGGSSDAGDAAAATAAAAAAAPSVLTRTLQVVVVLFGVILGLLVGMVMVRLLCRVAIFLICAMYGAICVVLVYFLLLQPANSHNALLVWYAGMVLASLIAALLSVTYPEAAVILGTSLDGAALAVYSAAHFLGHPPYLIAATPQIGIAGKTHDFVADRWWAASYAIVTIMLALFGVYTQRRVAVASKVSPVHESAAAAASNSLSDATAAPLPMPATQVESEHMQLTQQQPPQLRGDQAALPPHDYQVYGSSFVHDPNATSPYPPAGLLTDGPSANGLVSRMSSGYALPQRYLTATPNGANPDEQNSLVTVIEPAGSRSPSPMPVSAYGATDSQDLQYSVIQNLGADPLTPSVQPYKEGGSQPDSKDR